MSVVPTMPFCHSKSSFPFYAVLTPKTAYMSAFNGMARGLNIALTNNRAVRQLIPNPTPLN